MNRMVMLTASLLLTTGCGQAPSGPTSPTTPATLAPADQRVLDTELIAAAWANDVPKARALIERGADVNAQDSTRQSAFLIASSEGHLELLRLTLKHGADVDANDRFNGTALIRAAERGHAEVCAELIRAGVDIDHVNKLGWTALHEAVVLGDGDERAMATVRALVAGGADVTIRSGRFGMTPAEHAEQRGLADMARVIRAADRAN